MASLAAVKEMTGRDLRVFVNPAAAAESPAEQQQQQRSGKGEGSPFRDFDFDRYDGTEEGEADDFYDLTPEDYARLMSRKREDRFLKTAKIRNAETAARRSRIKKTTIRVQFPDSIVVEAKFGSMDLVVELISMLEKILVDPKIPFYIYTTPPKKIMKDHNVTFYDAGLVPGGLVYFSYDNDFEGPYLKETVLALQHLDQTDSRDEDSHVDSPRSPPRVASPDQTPPRQIAVSKPKPKWLRLGK